MLYLACLGLWFIKALASPIPVVSEITKGWYMEVEFRRLTGASPHWENGYSKATDFIRRLDQDLDSYHSNVSLSGRFDRDALLKTRSHFVKVAEHFGMEL